MTYRKDALKSKGETGLMGEIESNNLGIVLKGRGMTTLIECRELNLFRTSLNY